MRRKIPEAKEAKKLVEHPLKEMLASDRDWLRWVFTADEYYSLYLFCNIGLGYANPFPLSDDVHLLFCEFLDSTASPFKLAMMPRDFVKSWIIRGKAARTYLKNNNHRILMLMPTESLVRNASEQMASIFTKNKLIRYLFPECIPDEMSADRWTMLARTLPRTVDSPESTFTFAGVKTELTSGHYEKIFMDDIYAKEASESEEIAKKAKNCEAACEPLLEECADRELIHTCTRWNMDDIAAGIMGADMQLTDKRLFWAEGDQRFLCLKRSAIEDGEAIWPEKFSLQALQEKEQALESKGKGYFFAFQYLNNPIDESVVEFPSPRYWERAERGLISLRQPGGAKPITVEERHLTLTLTVDPAYTRHRQSDYSAICVIGSHPAGYRINMFSWCGKIDNSSEFKVKNATLKGLKGKILLTLWEAEKRGFPISYMAVEDNGPQIEFKNGLIEAAKDPRVGIYLPLRQLKYHANGTSNLSKVHRIRQMIDVVRDGLYYTHASFREANWEMRHFPASKKDNWLDAFAYQPQIWGIAPREAASKDELAPWEPKPDFNSPWRSFEPEVHREGYGG